MGVFTRCLSTDVIDKLKVEKLFMEKLLPDIRNGTVFPAIRNNYIDFYFKGRRLFEYKKSGFRTHYKFLVASEAKPQYVGESQIETENFFIKDFYSGYKSIKKACTVYFQAETSMVSRFYKQSLFSEKRMDGSSDDICLLDIECALESLDDPIEAGSGRKSTDKIDMVFLHKGTGELFLCEVKRYKDGRIKSKADESGNQPEVIQQIQKYDDQLAKKKDSIVTAYQDYITCMNSLIGTKISADKLTVMPNIVLLVTEFDRSQKKDGLGEVNGKLGPISGRAVYVGKPQPSTPMNLYLACH